MSEELSERAKRLLCGKGDGTPLGNLSAALDEIERLRAEALNIHAVEAARFGQFMAMAAEIVEDEDAP
jgi:hypothetical protein